MLLNHQSDIVCIICIFNVHILDSTFCIILRLVSFTVVMRNKIHNFMNKYLVFIMTSRIYLDHQPEIGRQV